MLIDLPIEKLKTYQGLNPCPDDFDRYWDESLAELATVESDVRLVPAEFRAPGAECFDLFFTGVGGARVHAKFLRPLGTPATPRPAVVIFHGYSGNCGSWCDKLKYVNAGFVVAALDCRGQGGLSEDTTPVSGMTFRGHFVRGLDDPDPKKLLFRSIFLDTAQLTRLVMAMPDVDAARVGITGGSQGGGLTFACAALVPEVNRAAAAYPFLSDYRRVWEMDLAKGAYEELSYYFRMFDPVHAREQEVFTKLGYIDIQHLAPRIRCSLVMFTGLMDTICPPSTQFAAYNKVVSPKEVVFYPDFGHESLPGCDDAVYEYMMEML